MNLYEPVPEDQELTEELAQLRAELEGEEGEQG